MKNLLKLSAGLLTAAFLMYSCDGISDSLKNDRLEENPVPAPEVVEGDPGSADFTRLVTIGNSLTAGFKDGALYDLGQSYSFGAQLAAQLAFAGGPETFNQPDINSANGFNAAASNPEQGVILGRFKLDTSIPGPSPVINGDLPGDFEGDRSALHNFGVPGIQVGQLLTAGTGTPGDPAFNPFYARFASQPGASTILGDALAKDPTFFTLWIGNNDVLGYALSGATNPAILTSTSDFQQRYQAVLQQLVGSGARGAIGTIPNVLAIPHFQAVQWNVLEFGEAEAAQLNEGLATLNAVYQGMADSNIGPLAEFTEEDKEQREVIYQAGNNPVFIVDPGLMDIGPQLDFLVTAGQITPEQREALEPYRQARPMVQGELLLLAAAQQLGTLADPNNPTSIRGVVLPLAPQFSLTMENIVEVETARQTFNGIMKAIADQINASATMVAVVDFDSPESIFTRLLGLDGSGLGVQVGTRTLAPDFSPNGVFSTDGIHPNARGIALVTNDYIRAIESAFGATIPHISDAAVLNIPSVQICAGDCVSQQSGRPSGSDVPLVLNFNNFSY
ncbi:MAG: hypothetical protein LAT84_05330 [Balneolia bacterium]|nr:hypothetical protein [Balneolia bacterium]